MKKWAFLPDGLFTRKTEDDDTAKPDDFQYSVSVDIPRPFASELQAHEGRERDKLTRKTGCRLIVNTPAQPAVQAGHAYVTLRGTTRQIDETFNQLRYLVARSNQDFAKDMKMDAAISVASEKIGWIRGQNHSKLEKLEKSTKTSIKIDRPKEDADSQLVHILGEPADVFDACSQLQESIDQYDPERAKKPSSANRSTNESRQRKATSDRKLDSTDNSSDQGVGEGRRLYPRHKKHQQDSSPPGKGHRNVAEDLHCEVTVHARRLLFACLLGKQHSNITRIRDETVAEIAIGKEDRQAEFQDVDIEGGLVDVLKGCKLVKEAFDTFDPNHPMSKERMAAANLNQDDVKDISADATLLIFKEMGGFLIGKNGSKIKQVETNSNVERIYVEKEEDEDGRKPVILGGRFECVIEALEQVLESLSVYKPRDSNTVGHPRQEQASGNHPGPRKGGKDRYGKEVTPRQGQKNHGGPRRQHHEEEKGYGPQDYPAEQQHPPQYNYQQRPPQPPQYSYQQGPPPPQYNYQQGPPPPQYNYQQGPPQPPQYSYQQGPPPPQYNYQQGPPQPQQHTSQQGYSQPWQQQQPYSSQQGPPQQGPPQQNQGYNTQGPPPPNQAYNTQGPPSANQGDNAHGPPSLPSQGYNHQGHPPPNTGYNTQGPPPSNHGYVHQGMPPPNQGYNTHGHPSYNQGYMPQGPPAPPSPGYGQQGPPPQNQGYNMPPPPGINQQWPQQPNNPQNQPPYPPYRNT